MNLFKFKRQISTLLVVISFTTGIHSSSTFVLADENVTDNTDNYIYTAIENDLEHLLEEGRLVTGIEYDSTYVTGEACTPDVIVTVDSEILFEDIDYVLDYENNVEAGTASAVITGIGKYTGQITKVFEIKEIPKVKVNKCEQYYNYISGKSKKFANKKIEIKIGSKKYTGKTNSKGKFKIKVPRLKKSGKKVYLRVKNGETYSKWKKTRVKEYKIPHGLTKGKSGYCSPLKKGKYYVSRGIGCGHYGIDLAASRGTPIYAAKYGKVVYSGYGQSGTGYGGYGYVVAVEDEDGNVEIYAHMCSQPCVKYGQTVLPGDKLGKVGNTGQSYGNHLHFEIRKKGIRHNIIDPEQKIKF